MVPAVLAWELLTYARLGRCASRCNHRGTMTRHVLIKSLMAIFALVDFIGPRIQLYLIVLRTERIRRKSSRAAVIEQI
jgi:hypothetical protein